MKIELKFEDFELADCRNEKFFASYNYLAIYDGKSSRSNRIGDLLCGSKIPKDVISTSNNVHLEWKSDWLVTDNHKGFKIKASLIGKLLNIFTKKN